MGKAGDAVTPGPAAPGILIQLDQTIAAADELDLVISGSLSGGFNARLKFAAADFSIPGRICQEAFHAIFYLLQKVFSFSHSQPVSVDSSALW